MDTVFFYTIVLPALIACLFTILATPLSLIFIKKLKLYDDPNKHKHPAVLHTKPIPRAGAIPMVIGILLASFLFLPFAENTIPLLAATLLALVVGVLDDKYDISPYIRFASNIAVATIVVASGITISFITNPLGGILNLSFFTIPFPFFANGGIQIISDLIAILWIVWVMNMLNWSKGVDGQMPGIVAISAIVIGILSLRFSALDVNSLLAAKLSFILAGASIGFLFFNFYPARIFPGYGATAVYMLLAVTSILSGAKLATAILVMGVPMVDGMFTILRRILSGRSPFWHDKKHLHHLLLKLGLSQRKIALCYWIFSAILGIISLSLSSSGKLFALIMLAVMVGGGILFLHIALANIDEKNRV